MHYSDHMSHIVVRMSTSEEKEMREIISEEKTKSSQLSTVIRLRCFSPNLSGLKSHYKEIGSYIVNGVLLFRR